MRYSKWFILLICFCCLLSCKKTKYAGNDTLIDSLVISFPNSFTPDKNGPQLNESYKPVYAFGAYKKDSDTVFIKTVNTPLKKYEMEIRDAENKVLFYTENINEGWNGTARNKSMPNGPYNAYFHLEGITQGIINKNIQFVLIR